MLCERTTEDYARMCCLQRQMSRLSVWPLKLGNVSNGIATGYANLGY